jgi:hypothetical protein
MEKVPIEPDPKLQNPTLGDAWNLALTKVKNGTLLDGDDDPCTIY